MASSERTREPYPLGRDFHSSIRLNYNHWMYKDITGCLLHPKIPLNQPNLRIADVGAGTAIWALEVASQLPGTTKIDCFDISADQFPPTTSRPNNVQLHVYDCFKPFQAEFLGSFDIVHARFWLCLVNNPDAPDLLRNFVSLLKPGGYLQWFEPLPLSVRPVYAPSPNFDRTALDRLVTMWHKPTPKSTYDWVEKLPESFCEHSLEVIAADYLPTPERYRFAWGLSQLAGIEDMVQVLMAQDEQKGEALNQFQMQLNEDFKKGAYIDIPSTWVVGRRAE